jgi:hypothetical protein
MTATIYNNDSVSLNTELYDGVEPWDPCTFWQGTINNGVTGANLTVAADFSPAPGIPYIAVNADACAFPLAGSGSLTGTFYPNSYVGTVTFRNTVNDRFIDYIASNYLTYICVSPGGLIVNAGADFTSYTTSYDGLEGTRSGGVGPFDIAWTCTSSPAGSSPVLVPNDALDTVITGMTKNGEYVFQLAVDPAVGAVKTDTVTVTRTGAPTAPPLTWQYTKFAGGGQMTIKRNGTAIVLASTTSSGTVTTGFSVGDTIQVIVTKTKDATTPPPGYTWENTAGLNIEEDGTNIFSDTETGVDVFVSVTTTFTFGAGSTYEIIGGSDRALIAE